MKLVDWVRTNRNTFIHNWFLIFSGSSLQQYSSTAVTTVLSVPSSGYIAFSLDIPSNCSSVSIVVSYSSGWIFITLRILVVTIYSVVNLWVLIISRVGGSVWWHASLVNYSCCPWPIDTSPNYDWTQIGSHLEMKLIETLFNTSLYGRLVYCEKKTVGLSIIIVSRTASSVFCRLKICLRD